MKTVKYGSVELPYSQVSDEKLFACVRGEYSFLHFHHDESVNIAREVLDLRNKLDEALKLLCENNISPSCGIKND